MTEAMNIDEFLSHETRGGGGGGGNYLGRWKKREFKAPAKGPFVDTWLHTRSQILATWQHPWPRIVERKGKDGDETTREVWSGSFNSWDAAAVLRRQYYLDRQTGERESPPVLCPMGRMLERVRQLVATGELSLVAPLFEFVGDDARKGKVLHAGGVIGLFRRDDLSREQLAEMKAAGIYQRDAWQENCMAQCRYLFQVCDNDAPDKGVQIAVETALLGDKVKEVIADAMDPAALGKERGNPLKHPYAIRWLYFPDEATFSKRYHARKLELELSEEVRRVIVDEPPRDVTRDSAPGNIAELRLSCEAHYVGPQGLLNWDEIFEPAEREATGGSAQAPARRASERPPPPKPAAAAPRAAVDKPKLAERKAFAIDPPDEDEAVTPGGYAQSTAAPISADEDDDMVECDECGGAMRADENVCPHCHFDYAPAPKQSEAKQPARKRSDAVAQPAQQAVRPGPRPFTPSKPAPAPAGRNRVRG